MPTWTPENLTKHHRKRITRDQGCFEDLMQIIGRSMTETEYAARSQAAIANAWAEYEGRGRDVQAGVYYPSSAYFVDDDLVVAITDVARQPQRLCRSTTVALHPTAELGREGRDDS